MKKSLTIISIAIVLIIIVSSIILSSKQKELRDKYFNKEVSSVIIDQVNDQYSINENLNAISNTKKYTLEAPYIEINPYKISPLSAVIIFQTDDEEEIKVYINDKYQTTMEKSNKHIIPIYGLKEDYENVVRLESSKVKVEHTLKTQNSNLNYRLNVKKSYNTDDLYFTVASLETYLTGWDKDGNLRFYLTVDNRMDVEFLDNNHFLIGVSQGQYREQFIGFVEMDFLGKIYNYYTLDNGYSFEFQDLGDNKVMLAGGSSPIYFDHQIIYTLDLNNGKNIDQIDIYDVVKKIDPEFNEKYLGPQALRNGFYYDEKSGDLVVSFREINTIWCFNYHDKSLKWVLTNPNNELFKNEVWKNYLVSVDTNRYPLGQHSPQITSDGNLLYYNNGYNRYEVVEHKNTTKLSEYKNAYTSIELLSINNETKKAKTIYSEDFDKKKFSIKYGYSRILDNNNKLINNGYILKNSYYKDANADIAASEATPDYSYAQILELDKNNKVIFEATCEEGKFRAFKHNLYNDKTDNINISKLNKFNTIKNTKLKEDNYKSLKIENSTDWIYTVKFTKNTFETNYKVQATDSLDLYFMDQNGKVYILNYKDKDSSVLGKIFNINDLHGKYALFINLNGEIYNTNKIYNF